MNSNCNLCSNLERIPSQWDGVTQRQRIWGDELQSTGTDFREKQLHLFFFERSKIPHENAITVLTRVIKPMVTALNVKFFHKPSITICKIQVLHPSGWCVSQLLAGKTARQGFSKNFFYVLLFVALFHSIKRITLRMLGLLIKIS